MTYRVNGENIIDILPALGDTSSPRKTLYHFSGRGDFSRLYPVLLHFIFCQNPPHKILMTINQTSDKPFIALWARDTSW